MRVLIDANVFISYLLAPQRPSPSATIIRSAILGSFVLLLPEALLEELTAKVGEKPYLAQRITPDEAAELAEILHLVAETISRITQPIPAITRDAKDDYLIAYAVIGEADYLVSGDSDLLALDQVDGVKIVTPRQFSDLCESPAQG